MRYPTTLPSSSTTRSVSALVTKITYSSVRPLATSTMLTQRTKNHVYQCWLMIVAPGKRRKRTILLKHLLIIVAIANANTFSFLFTNIDSMGDQAMISKFNSFFRKLIEPLEHQNSPRLDTMRRAITSSKFYKFLRVIMSQTFQAMGTC